VEEIDFTGGGSNSVTSLKTSSSATTEAAGNMQFVAFSGTGGNAGKILSPGGVLISSGGSGSGNNGNVTVTAGAASGTTISLAGGISTIGGSGSGGNISLATATPTVNGPMSVTGGAIQSGSFGIGTAQNGILTVIPINAYSNVSLVTGSSVTVTANRQVGVQTQISGTVLTEGQNAIPGTLSVTSGGSITTTSTSGSLAC